jgi:hypothetical protein
MALGLCTVKSGGFRHLELLCLSAVVSPVWNSDNKIFQKVKKKRFSLMPSIYRGLRSKNLRMSDIGSKNRWERKKA